MSIPSHNKSYNGNIFTPSSYMNSANANSGIPISTSATHPGLQYLQAYQSQPQQQQPPLLHPQQTTQDYYTTSSSSNNTLSSGSASSTAPTSIADMPLPGQQQLQQNQQRFNQTTTKTIIPQMISGTGASSNPPMPLDPNITTKFTNNDIQILRQLLIAGEKYKWKQITKEINSSTNHTQHVMAAISKNQQHLQQFQHLRQNSMTSHNYQHQQLQHQHMQQQQQQQQTHQHHLQQQQMHQQQLLYGFQQPSHLQNNNIMHKSTSLNLPYMSNSMPTTTIPPHRTQNNIPHHAMSTSISSHSNSNSHSQPAAATTSSATHAPPNPVPLKNVSPTFVMKQYQQLLGLPNNLVYFGTLGSSLPYVIAANGWNDIDQEAYNYPFNMDEEE